jgi:hypothetical protein
MIVLGYGTFANQFSCADCPADLFEKVLETKKRYKKERKKKAVDDNLLAFQLN